MYSQTNAESRGLANRLHNSHSPENDARARYELQARKMAGAMVLAGVALGLLVHPYWLGLSAFVGGGLIFAGIAGKCPRATLLAKLPGNRGCCATNQNVR